MLFLILWRSCRSLCRDSGCQSLCAFSSFTSKVFPSFLLSHTLWLVGCTLTTSKIFYVYKYFMASPVCPSPDQDQECCSMQLTVWSLKNGVSPSLTFLWPSSQITVWSFSDREGLKDIDKPQVVFVWALCLLSVVLMMLSLSPVMSLCMWKLVEKGVTFFLARFRCWISSETHLLYIIHGPVQAALLVSN